MKKIIRKINRFIHKKARKKKNRKKYKEKLQSIKHNKELYDNYPLDHFGKRMKNNKLKYKLKMLTELKITITTCDQPYNLKLDNNELLINNKKHSIDGGINNLIIYEINKNQHEIYINEQFIAKIGKIINIELSENNYYKCSINIPISLNKTDKETLVNFDYIIKKYLKMDYQINILHTDYNTDLLDNFVLNNDKLNYIYVENPFFFNLGYTRNLYKYLNLSENVMFVDVDIPLEDGQICIMIKQIKEFDIVKPYNKKLIHLTKEEKYNYIKNPFIPIREPRCLFTLTGGITMFKKKVLEDCGDYEEINCYGGEDRFLDVIVSNKGYKIKKNEFYLIHLWHSKIFAIGEQHKNWRIQAEKQKKFNKKYYNCVLDLKGESISNFVKNHDDIHCNCNHNTKYIDQLIDHKKKYNGNLNLFQNNLYIDSIIMKKELKINDKILFIMGNGPSLGDIMNNPSYLKILKDNHTFGLNSAYRMYEKYNFYPTYFGCFDYIVNENHKNSFEQLVLGNNSIQEFYFIGNTEKGQNMYSEKVRQSSKFKKFDFNVVKFIDKDRKPKNPDIWLKDNTLKTIQHLGSSGCDASQIGLLKGYNKIYLLGCDCNYNEKYNDNIHRNKDNILTVTKKIDKNPNYWFDGYQQIGDKFNVPNCLVTQMRSWERLFKYYYKNENIVNLSSISKIQYFPKKKIRNLFRNSFRIGIIAIFIKKYVVFFENYINNIESKFLPNNKKHYFIITDNEKYIKDIALKKNITFTICKEDYIGWPYETLYRFKYINNIDKRGLFNRIDYLYFLNSNISIIKKEYDLIPECDHIFVKHNGFHNETFNKLAKLETLEKNKISTAYAYGNKNNNDYVYFGGGFYGATKKAFLNMSYTLEKNIESDEKNNYIAIWHDESHLNHYINNVISRKNCYILSHLYHGNGNVNKKILYSNGFRFIFLPKQNFIKDIENSKNFTNMKSQHNGKIILNKYNEKIFNSKEDLELINGYRPSEIHTIIIWDAKKNYSAAKKYINDLPIKNMNILYEKQITLTKDEEFILANSVYNKTTKGNPHLSRVKSGKLYLIIIEDTKPIYLHEKATSCWQVLNKNMKIIKEDIRLKIGGKKNSYHTAHTSYNQEEALLVLKPLNLTKYVKRPIFSSFSDFFNHLNKHTKLKYLIQRSAHEIEYSPEFFKNSKDVDILVNDYYYFKALTGARSRNTKAMRENDNGGHIQSKISIGNIEVAFDIRFIGDNYIDSNWEKDMINRRIKHTLKQNVVINIPNNSDELYSLIYNIIIQKPNPEKSKHIPRVQKLLKVTGINEELDFSNTKNIKYFLDKFMDKNGYKYKRPFDKSVKFNVDGVNKNLVVG